MRDGDWDDEDFEPDENDEIAPSETVACPECGSDVYEDAEQCPSCGWYIVHSTSEWAGRPWWWIALGLAGVVAVIGVFVLLGW